MPGSHDEEVRRETGGPPSPVPAASPSSSEVAVDARITALEALPTADLQIEWRRLYRVAPPSRLSRDLLVRGVAHKLQEQVYGGLSQDTRRRLHSLVEGPGKQNRLRAASAVPLKPGTKLVREWQGHVHTVDVRDDGFDYRGQYYRSLTQIARLITGAHWSGPLFFGLRKRQSAMETTGE